MKRTFQVYWPEHHLGRKLEMKNGGKWGKRKRAKV